MFVHTILLCDILSIPNKSTSHIRVGTKYLGYHSITNTVELYNEHEARNTDNLISLQWLIEHDDQVADYYYIKAIHRIQQEVCCYVGCPNQNNQLFLYSSKGQYTRWNILTVQEDTETKIQHQLVYVGEKFDNLKYEIVVAYYQENIDWIYAYADLITLYCKNSNSGTIGNKIHKIEHLPNIGREGHTYLHHIIHKYDTLKEYTIFLQAGWIDHNPTIYYALDNLEQLLPIQPLGWKWLENVPPENILNTAIQTDFGLKYLVTQIHKNTLQIVKPFYFFDTGINCLKTLSNNFSNLTNHFLQSAHVDFSKYPTKFIPFTYCALFGVNKQFIQTTSKAIYKNIYNYLFQSNDQGGPEGYVIERMWLCIFGYDYDEMDV